MSCPDIIWRRRMNAFDRLQRKAGTILAIERNGRWAKMRGYDGELWFAWILDLAPA